MSKKIKIDEDFTKFAKEAVGVYFWESEYWKRKFLLENEEFVELTSKEISIINKYFDELLNRYGCIGDYNSHRSPIKIMQREFVRRYTNSRIFYKKCDKKMSEFFSYLEREEFPHEIYCILLKMHGLSFCYHYFVDDLVVLTDMDKLAPSILDENSVLPPAPCPYHHKDAVYEIDECVYRSGFPVQSDQRLVVETVRGAFECDYMALVNFKHTKFKYSDVISTFRRQLAFLLYCHNGFDDLSEDEKKDLIYTFKSDSGKGYGSEFAVSRAVGLWIWDNKFYNKNKKKIDIFREIESTKYNNNFDVKNLKSGSGVYKRLERILDGTERCIASGKVLRVSGMSNSIE